MIFKLLKIVVFSGVLLGQIDYGSQIQPIFNNHCLECHVSINGSGALVLDSYEYLMQGDSNNGPVVIPFNADSSLLYKVLLRDSVIVPNEPICCRMPKNADPLPIDQIIAIYLYTLIAYVILTLLIQFELVNRYNKIVDTILRTLIGIHEPLLIQIRKVVPFIGGMDFSPVIVILLLSFLRNLITYDFVGI